MPVCVATAVGAGGAQYLVLDTAQTDLTNCTYLLEDGTSYAWRELTNLTVPQATEIGTLIGIAWATAFTFRLILRALKVDEAPPV